jgi:predicted DNA-binding WGR domain protein
MSAAIILYRIDPAKRMHRFYRMAVQPDLFGAWCLIREWGRIVNTQFSPTTASGGKRVAKCLAYLTGPKERD